VKVQWLTFVFGVTEILDLNVGPETALMIRVFCFARSVQANGECYVTYTEGDSFISSVVKPGRDSSFGIATRYGLDRSGIECRWGARFSAPVQIFPEAHVASCRMGTDFLFAGPKGRGASLTTNLPSSAEIKERILSVCAFMACCGMNFLHLPYFDSLYLTCARKWDVKEPHSSCFISI
jgi:hypothetical protein